MEIPHQSFPVGFRFHPTDEELINHYLKGKNSGLQHDVEVIPEIDVCKIEPWDLPEKSLIKMNDHEWFFFAPRDRKYPTGHKSNRATKAGYWKSTGKDRQIRPRGNGKVVIGMKKTLAFYRGRAPKGERLNWTMHEYRVVESDANGLISNEGSYVLYRLFEKPSEKDETSLPSLLVSSPATEDKSDEIEIISNREDCLPDELQECQLCRPDEHVNPLECGEKNEIIPIEAEAYDRNMACNENKVSAASEVDMPFFDDLTDLFFEPHDNLFLGVSSADHDPSSVVHDGYLPGDSDSLGDQIPYLPTTVSGDLDILQDPEPLWSNDLWSASDADIALLLQQVNTEHLQTDDKKEGEEEQDAPLYGGYVLQGGHVDDMLHDEKTLNEMGHFFLKTGQTWPLVGASRGTDRAPRELTKEASHAIQDRLATETASRFRSSLVLVAFGAIPIVLLAMYAGFLKYF